MKKWLRNMTIALSMGSLLGLSACAYTPSEGGGTPIVSPFGKVALVEYVDNNTLFLDYDGEHSYTYDKIVDRQLTAMAEDITSRLWTIYGNQNDPDEITIMDTLNNNNIFLTETISGIVVDNATKYFGEEESGKAPINLGNEFIKDNINFTQGGTFGNTDETVTQNVYYDVQADSKSGNVTIKDFGDGNTEYQKYNHYYIDEEKTVGSSLNAHYGVVFEGNYASLFNNLSNLLYHMNNEHLTDTEKAAGTIVHTDLPKSGEENNYNLSNVLNFKDTINGGPRWAVVAKWNDGEITDEDVVEGGDEEGKDPRSDDYYQFFFYFNSNNEYKNKADFETAVKAKFQADDQNKEHEPFNETSDQLIITEQPAWEIAKNTPITKQDQLTKVIKKYLASIIVAGGVDNLYLQDDVTSDTTDAIYHSRIQNITYTANWLELYYDDILNVIKQKIIGDELWGPDAGYGEYLQGLSDDCYNLRDGNISDSIFVENAHFYNESLLVPMFEYNIFTSWHILTFESCINDNNKTESQALWNFINPFLTQYLIARNYQGYDLLVPTLLRSCAHHTYFNTQEEGEDVIENRWFVSSKSGINIYNSPDDYAGDKVEIKPAKQYKSVLFFAKGKTDLTKIAIWVFFGNVQQAFAVRPIITLVNGDEHEKEITTLSTEDYSLSATKDSEYVGGDKETGKYIVKADNEYTGYDDASFIIEFNKGSIAGAGSYTPIPAPTIADNDWVLQPSYTNGKLTSVDAILNAYNYIQISFEQFDLSGNPVQENIPYGFVIDITN